MDEVAAPELCLAAEMYMRVRFAIGRCTKAVRPTVAYTCCATRQRVKTSWARAALMRISWARAHYMRQRLFVALRGSGLDANGLCTCMRASCATLRSVY